MNRAHENRFRSDQPHRWRFARQSRQNPRRLRSPRRRRRRTRSHAGAGHHRLSAAGSRLQIALRSAKSRNPGATARTRRPRRACSSVSSIATKAAANLFTMPPLCSKRGQPIRKTHKSLLPTYDVFDEDRYFEPARSGRAARCSAAEKSASPFAKISGRNIICRGRFTTSSRCAAWSSRARN